MATVRRTVFDLFTQSSCRDYLLLLHAHVVSLLAQAYGPIEEDPEYKLMVESNNLTVEIDNEISALNETIWS